MIDLTSLKKAVHSLENAISSSQQLMKSQKFTAEDLNLFKAGVIQNFEFTYELCWKFMKRWLEANLPGSLEVGANRRQLFRYAAENGLIADSTVWFKYHELRNQTSHTYDVNVADEIFFAAPEFLLAAHQLLKSLESKND